MEKKPFYITTPIYYPSGNPHIGHCYTTVACDSIARYRRMQGYNVMFLTGTDEHGLKIEQKAAEKGVTPKEYVDEVVKTFKKLWSYMNISYDRYIRTTDDYHIETVQKILKALYDKGYIYKGEYKGKYCTPCESFWTESQLDENGCCPECHREVTEAKEEAYFFKMSPFADRIEKLLTETDYLQPKTRATELVNNFIKPGLEDLCVSRTTFKWGIPVTFDDKHVVYVWIDALSNYISALGFWNEQYNDFDKFWPADVHMVAKDIMRFHAIIWPAMLMALDLPLPKHLAVHGWITFNGQKMSKSKGNAVDPFDALETYGADAIRWYFYTASAPWIPKKFSGKLVLEGQRKFMGTLWNTYAFFVLYANIDNFDATKYTLEYDKLPVMDKWILSKMNTMVKDVDNNLGNYRIPEAARVLQDFVDDLSNWYVRRSRERFWAKGMEQDKINAYMTLYTALVTVAKAAAPMIPFMTEDIYQNLVRSIDADAPESIHLCDYPEVNEAWIDKDLEANMEELLEIVVLGRACRNTANIKNRQPIGTMYVKAEKAMDKFYTDIIADELNVKEVKFADDVESFISYSFKPQLRTVGPKYGKLLNGIRTALSEIDGTAAMKELRDNGVLVLDIDGNRVELAEEDLLIETAQSEGYVTETDGETSVVLDTNLTPELIQEGFVREIISKVQTMRKEAGFEVMDKIIVYAKDNDKIMDIMKANQDEIKREVLAENIILGEAEGYTKEWNINKEAVTLGVSKVQEEN